MSSSTPQWVYSALDDALVAIGATASPAARRSEIERILGGWNMRGRSFHNARYLSSVLEHLDKLEGAATDPAALRVAFAYRGAQEEVGWEDADMESVPAAVPQITSPQRLAQLGIDPDQVARIQELVDQLSSHRPDPDDLDAKIIIDADMAVLASPPQQYRRLLEGLRSEVPHMDSAVFLQHRRRAIKRLLSRRNVFFSPIGRQWDQVARENLEAELGAIEAQLAAFGDEGEGTSVAPGVEPRDQWVIRHSLKTKRAAVADMHEGAASPAGTGQGDIDAADPEDPAGPELAQASDDSVAMTSTLEMIPDLIEEIRRRRR